MSSPLRRLRHIPVVLAALCLVALLLVLSVKSAPPTLPAEGAVAPHSTTPHSTTQATGYDLVGSDGGVFVFHGGFYGSLPGLGIHVDNIVGIAPAANYGGYYLVGSDGGVFSFGDTAYEGSLPGLGIHVNDVVGIVPSSDDKGYFLVGGDGGVFSFGDTAYEGSLPGLGVHVDDVAGIAATPSNTGYWVLQANGQVTGFGDAPNLPPLPAASGASPLRVHRLDIGWAGLLGREQLRSGVRRSATPTGSATRRSTRPAWCRSCRPGTMLATGSSDPTAQSSAWAALLLTALCLPSALCPTFRSSVRRQLLLLQHPRHHHRQTLSRRPKPRLRLHRRRGHRQPLPPWATPVAPSAHVPPTPTQ